MSSTQGKLIILTAPSGSGKSTITQFLIDKYPALAFSISATTRPPRGEEKNGVEYYFLSPETFEQKIEAGDFVEYKMVYAGRYYGTLRSELERMWSTGKIPMLDIDVEGAVDVKRKFEDDCLSIFIQPPSIEELQRRLEFRSLETAEEIAIRIQRAAYEISFSPQFDKIILNDQLSKACDETEQVIKDFLGW